MFRLLLLTAIVLGLTVSGIYLYNSKTTVQVTKYTHKGEQTLNIEKPLEASELENIPNLRPYEKYTSEKLGISFFYPRVDVDEIRIHEQGNTICLLDFPTLTECTPGIHQVTVLTKNPNEGVEAALKRMFLNEEKSAVCFVEEISLVPYGWASTYKQSKIKIQNSSEYNKVEMEEACPGLNSYFRTTSEHPDKILQFSANQYALPPLSTDSEYQWSDTIQFEEK